MIPVGSGTEGCLVSGWIGPPLLGVDPGLDATASTFPGVERSPETASGERGRERMLASSQPPTGRRQSSDPNFRVVAPPLPLAFASVAPSSANCDLQNPPPRRPVPGEEQRPGAAWSNEVFLGP